MTQQTTPPTPDKLAEAKRILKDYDDESHMWTDEDNLEDKYIKKLLAAQNLVSRAEQEETPIDHTGGTIVNIPPTPDKLTEARRFLAQWKIEIGILFGGVRQVDLSDIRNLTCLQNKVEKMIDSFLIFQDLVSRAEQEETPMGASQWREYGKKYGYWDYFLKEQKEIILSRVMSEYEKHNYMNPDEFNAIVRAKLNYQDL